MPLEIPLGTQATQQHTVGAEHLALSWHSGAAQVLATPQMIGWMEAAAVAAVGPSLPAGYSTVGTAVDVRHLAATVQGTLVTIYATLVAQENKLLTFEVEACDENGLVGRGTHQRYIVELARFEARARARATGIS